MDEPAVFQSRGLFGCKMGGSTSLGCSTGGALLSLICFEAEEICELALLQRRGLTSLIRSKGGGRLFGCERDGVDKLGLLR